MIPPISRILWGAFGRYAEWYVSRHFHGVRLLGAGQPPPVGDGPLVIYLNHPSWWDPLACVLLARRVWPHRRHYAPIDSAALDRYRFFGKLGFFGIEQGTARGGAVFLRTALEILREPSSVLWITAQGEFTDTRLRPVRLRPGLPRLLARLDRATILPLALEYPFWNQPRPEILAAFGPRIGMTSGDSLRPSQRSSLLEHHLEQTADALALAAIPREERRFTQLRGGANGINPFYDLWQRLKASRSGRRYHAEHPTEWQR